MSAYIVAFACGVFFAPLMFVAMVGGNQVLRIGKSALANAQQLPQTPERVAKIEDLKMRIETLEGLMNRRQED